MFFGGARGGGKTDGMLGEWTNENESPKHAGPSRIGVRPRQEETGVVAR
jgi:hypothetical protein